MKSNFIISCVVFLSIAGCGADKIHNKNEPYIQAAGQVEAGKYLITIGGCNDCHTDDYLMSVGKVPESEWLTGSSLGWRGPWGTTYPPNLRIRVQELTEDQWVEMLHTRKTMLPMPWASVNHMSEQDLKAIYAYIKSLGPKGERSPLAVAPNKEPGTPYFSMFPQNMPAPHTGSTIN